MEHTIFNLPLGYNKYILRSTDEEVEITAVYQKEDGSRSDEDWVTYIDSKGIEHIKEHLNIQLDFKAISNNIWDKITEFSKYPNVRNNRIFDLVKELIVHGWDTKEAVNKAIEVVDTIGIEYENK